MYKLQCMRRGEGDANATWVVGSLMAIMGKAVVVIVEDAKNESECAGGAGGEPALELEERDARENEGAQHACYERDGREVRRNVKACGWREV